METGLEDRSEPAYLSHQAERAGETVLAVRMLALLRDASMAPRTVRNPNTEARAP
jgi:hypothetical protein